MNKFLFNSLIFSFLFVTSNLFGDSVTTVKSPDRFTVFSKIITTDKYSTFRVILSGPFNGEYGYDSSVRILINGQSSNYSYGNGNPSLRESGGIVGYVDYYPQTQKSSLKTDCDIIPGKIYLIGELRRNSGTTSVSDLLTFGTKSELTNMQVYCRVFKLDHSRIYNKESDLSSRINDPDFSPSKK